MVHERKAAAKYKLRCQVGTTSSLRSFRGEVVVMAVMMTYYSHFSLCQLRLSMQKYKKYLKVT